MRAYYSADRESFYRDSDSHILGELTRRHHHDVEAGQKQAWLKQVDLMRAALAEIGAFTLYFEFAIPRMGKRADAVVVIGKAIFVIEFKDGEARFTGAGIEQVEDYALDLKNFHAAPFVDGYWLGLAPDDSPLLIRDAGIWDFYALDLSLP